MTNPDHEPDQPDYKLGPRTGGQANRKPNQHHYKTFTVNDGHPSVSLIPTCLFL